MKELEMILQALTTLGEAGKEAFIWWLIMDKGLGFLGGITFLVTGYFVIIKGVHAFLITSKVAALRDLMGIGIPGRLTDSEYRLMCEWINNKKNK